MSKSALGTQKENFVNLTLTVLYELKNVQQG